MGSLTYEKGRFAREFTWALMSWNSAEFAAKLMLSHMLGSTKTSLAIVADMGNRGVLLGIEAAARELDDKNAREHLRHFSKGFGILLGYRNLYVHNLRRVRITNKPGTKIEILALVSQVRGEGRLKAINRPVTVKDMRDFREWADELSQYGTNIGALIGGGSELNPYHPVSTPQASLQKPTWPASLQNTPHYLQGP